MSSTLAAIGRWFRALWRQRSRRSIAPEGPVRDVDQSTIAALEERARAAERTARFWKRRYFELKNAGKR